MRFTLLVLPFVVRVIPLAAQAGLPGFSPPAAAREHAVEAILVGVPDAAAARNDARTLAGQPHVAGTPAQQQTARYVLTQMALAGLDTSRINFAVYLPYPDSIVVERVTPIPLRLALEEPPIPGDPTTALRPWPAMNGSSGAGDVTAPVIYVNYGLPEDYALLDSLQIGVRGKIVIARYGHSFRGIKAREAERHGAAALLLYSDPQGDGYFVGDVYPDGPMRNPDEVQRGSVYNGDGDPSTPGWPSVPGARRLPPDSMGLPKIPVVPLGYRNATRFLEALRGASVPQPWQGALPFRYHLGAGEVVARVAVWPQTGTRAYKTITNTFGILRGAEWPAEMVIIGGHRDAWGPGAKDDVSGVVSVLAAARAWGAAARQGLRPRRTLVFATWDAEEWGLVGSVEYVELMEETLRAQAVAYVNNDTGVEGRVFGAAGSASLQGLIYDVTRGVTQPGETVSVYAAWRRQEQTADSAQPNVGNLGGGSDYSGFYNQLGIPAVDIGFGGDVGDYHSAYDTWTSMERFADPGYLSHLSLARLSAVIMARLANADVHPYDYAQFGRHLGWLVDTLERHAQARGWTLPVGDLRAAADSLTAAGLAVNAARDAVLAGKTRRAALTQANQLLRGVEREIGRPEGLEGRPWMHNLLMASDRDNGYAEMPLPSINEAIRDGDRDRAEREVRDLARRVLAAARRLGEARDALRAR